MSTLDNSALSNSVNNYNSSEIIEELDKQLFHHFDGIIKLEKDLTRKLVSFQANKGKASYRWYKYKEAFSADLVHYFLKKYSVPSGAILDPFVGAGTALFASSELGYDADGIELLPIGQKICQTRKICLEEIDEQTLSIIKKWKDKSPWNNTSRKEDLSTLRITDGAYPKKTKDSIESFLGAIQREKKPIQEILRFALLCVLEKISYTRKDGQYLRWDHRAQRRNGKSTFNKGTIYQFDEAIKEKLDEIITDLSLSETPEDFFDKLKESRGSTKFINGSCLNELPLIEKSKYEAIITSPPYCNRYDYTRTYALELALLGVEEKELIELRQQMLSCTVENREKELLSMNKEWEVALRACENNSLLQEIVKYLEHQKITKQLNNNGIPRMVKGYFYEMACVIQELYRVLKDDGLVFMVNDNVRYAGVSISVDLILSKIAEDIGFKVKNILVLPQAKGNSSQQMGAHGRNALRKTVYVWEK